MNRELSVSYKVAIVIPCWNVDQYIGEMLTCLQKQTYSDWKAFCVDDCSTDNTVKIIQTYAISDSRIVYVRRYGEKKGAQVCRNQGLRLTEGAEYVIFFDSDDLVADYCIEQRVKHMDNCMDLDFSVFPMIRFYKRPNDSSNEIWGYDYLHDVIRCFLNRTLTMVVTTNIYRRQSIVDNRLEWDENLKSLQDADWNIHAILSGLCFDYASDGGARVDYFWRAVNNGISSKIRTVEHYDSHVYQIDKTLKSLSDVQLIKYEIDIKSTIKEFAFMMMQAPSSFKGLLKIDWFRKHLWFKYRLIFSCLIGQRGSKKLFPYISRYRKHMVREWKEFQMEKIDKIITDKPNCCLDCSAI